MSAEEHQERYLAAAHAMQSGVAMEMNYDATSTTPKHLRVGINSALVETGALVKLLIEKGVLTDEEWFKELADNMERERDMYANRLSERLGGANITLA